MRAAEEGPPVKQNVESRHSTRSEVGVHLAMRREPLTLDFWPLSVVHWRGTTDDHENDVYAIVL